MTAPRIAMLHGGTFWQLATLEDPALMPYHIRPLYLPDLEDRQLADIDIDILVVADRLRAAHLRPWTSRIMDIAHAGGTVIVLGENEVHPWLPCRSFETRPTNFWWWRTGDDSGLRLRNRDHIAWQYLNEHAAIWHYHAVIHPPEGAVSLVDLEEEGGIAGSTLYVDDVSTAGRLIVSTSDPVYHHGSGFMPGATQQLYCLLRYAGENPPDSGRSVA